MTFSSFTRLCFTVALGTMIGAVGFVYGQAGAPIAAPTCEQQLEQATRTILKLRKVNAESDYRNAALEESLMDAQKKLAAADAKSKAVEKK